MGRTNSNGDRSREETSRLDYFTKVVQLRTAYVVLAGVVLTTLTTWLQVSKIMEQMTHVAQDMALLVDKPLEGEWLFKSSYEKYYDEPKPELLFGKGNAVMIWKHQQKRYDVQVTYGIHRSGGPELLSGGSDLLAATFKGLLSVDEEGWPLQQNFTMSDFVILTRLHYKSYPPSLRTYQFTNCTYMKKKSQNRADKITCDFETPQTKSKIELTWSAPLR
jgi:hypothetical protein